MPAPADGSLGIVVVNFGSHRLLAENLGSVELDRSETVVVVVDNFHSTEEQVRTRAYVEGRGWEFIANDTNLGFGAAVNIGADRALELGCSALLLLNPDAVASAEVLGQLRRGAAANPAAMVSPRICRPDGSVWFQGSRLHLDSGRLTSARVEPHGGEPAAAVAGGPTGPSTGATGSDADSPNRWLTAACLLVPATLWRRLGGFDPDYFLYWEDVDLSYRCLQAGGTLQVRTDLTAVHSVGATQDEARKSVRYYFYNCRNRLLFAAKHLNRRQLIFWMIRTPAQTWAVLLRGGGRRGLVSRPAVLLAGVVGSLAGITAVCLALTRPRPEPSGDVRARHIPFPFIPESPVPPPTITVLQSFPRLSRTTNPYLSQLMSALPVSVVPLTFSWSRALRETFDVFHVHWPELLVRGSTRPRTLARQALFGALLLRLRLRRTAVVRTVHNAVPHEQGRRVESMLLAALDRLTTLRVELNDAPTSQHPSRTRVILHGHYRDWYRRPDLGTGNVGQLLFFGLIRGYKRVPELLAAFAELPEPALRLHIVGKPADDDLRARVSTAEAADARVRCWLEYVDDDLLAAQIDSAELVVLPYAEMYNSGAVILALSLARPVLVPATPQNCALATEVGPGWVTMYDGELTARTLADGLSSARRTASVRGHEPQLSGRDWSAIGSAHLHLYRGAVALSRRRSQTVAGATSG